MYRLMILADDGRQRKMLTVGGDESLSKKDMPDFIGNDRAFEWLHSKKRKVCSGAF